MSLAHIKRVVDHFALRCGYMPVDQVKANAKEKERTERGLRHKLEKLEQEVMVRKRMETEIEFLRHLELSRSKQETGTQMAVCRLDHITTKLCEMMKDIWPDAYLLSLQEAEAEVDTATHAPV